MNITQIRLIETIDLPAFLAVSFEQDDGTPYKMSFPLPSGWDGWTRAERLAWVTAQVEAFLSTNTIQDGAPIIYPDRAAKVTAKLDFRGLPGWATWTGAEASDWIDTNVTDLASAKTALVAMAKAIVFLRDIVVER
jgi:hypothetical protein